MSDTSGSDPVDAGEPDGSGPIVDDVEPTAPPVATVPPPAPGDLTLPAPRLTYQTQSTRPDLGSTVPDEPRSLGWRFWVPLALGAIGTDIAVRNPPWNNVAATVGVVAIVVGLLASGRVKDVFAQAMLAVAAVLSFFLWFRTNPALIVFDVIAILTLGWMAVVHSRGRSVLHVTPVNLMVRLAESLAMAFETIPDSAGELICRRRKAQAASGRTGDTLAAVARGAMIAVPVLLLFGFLLASADAVFASFFSVSFGNGFGSLLGNGIGHIVLAAIGAFSMLILLRLSSRSLGTAEELGSGPRLGLVETMVVLVSLDLLFAAFGVAQVLALSGSADEVLADAGLTVKEYAREGFFQLLWVAGLTAMVLIVLDVVSRHHQKRGRTMIRAASLVAVALTFVIVAVAFNRLGLYIDFDGHTPLRFYSSVFSIWIAVVFVILAVRIAGFRPEINWFTAAVAASGVIFLLGLNIANPEALIMQENLSRDDSQIIWHMDQFSADGNVVLANDIDQLPADVQEEVLEKFCLDGERDDRYGDDEARSYQGLSYNRSERSLTAAYERLCPA